LAKSFEEFVKEVVHYCELQLQIIGRFREMILSDALKEVVRLLEEEKKETLSLLKESAWKQPKTPPSRRSLPDKTLQRLDALERMTGLAASEMTDLPLVNQFFKQMLDFERMEREVFRAIFHRNRDSQSKAALFLQLSVRCAAHIELIKNVRKILDEWPQDATDIMLKPRG